MQGGVPQGQGLGTTGLKYVLVMTFSYSHTNSQLNICNSYHVIAIFMFAKVY